MSNSTKKECITVRELLVTLKDVDLDAIIEVRGTIIGLDGEEYHFVLSPEEIDIQEYIVILDF